MPRGRVPGWSLVWAEDFTTNAAVGSFRPDDRGLLPGKHAYGRRLTTYPCYDVEGGGLYDAAKTMSVKNSSLIMDLRTGRSSTGRNLPLSATVEPKVGPRLYGRYSLRMRATATGRGWGAVALLWPQQEQRWPATGEIDWPEGDLLNPICGFQHFADPSGAQAVVKPQKLMRWRDWHVYTLEWTAGRIRFLIDGKVVRDNRDRVPTTPMRWLLQSGPSRAAALKAQTTGRIEIDWMTIHRPA